MGTGILFVLLIGNGPAMMVAEFVTKEQCERAGEAVKRNFSQPLRRIDYFCHPREE